MTVVVFGWLPLGWLIGKVSRWHWLVSRLGYPSLVWRVWMF